MNQYQKSLYDNLMRLVNECDQAFLFKDFDVDGIIIIEFLITEFQHLKNSSCPML